MPRSGPWRALDGFLRDLRFAVRSLRRTPIFALTAALVLGLGIGANATVFTIVNTLLLRPLPFERADDVVQVRRRTPFGSSGSFPMHDYLALTTQRSALSALAILDVIGAGRYTLSISAHRFNMLMLTMFSGLALALAAIGVYGLTAYAAAQRAREIGLLGAIFLGNFLRSLLFGISATDGVTIVVVIATMTAVVVAATYLPASRASRIDPILAMRQE